MAELTPSGLGAMWDGDCEGKAVVVLMVCRYPLNLLTALLLLLVLKAGDTSWWI